MLEQANRFLRSSRAVPSRRMTVRQSGMRPGPTSPAHRSFRMTRTVRKANVKHAFGGSFVPETFEAAGRHAKASEASDKDVAFYRRMSHSDRALETTEEQLRYERGLLKEAHALHEKEKALRLREGLNPAGHEPEQARKELKSFRATQEKPVEQKRLAAEPVPNPLEMVRARLGIQHSAIGSPPPTQSAWEAPTPLAGGNRSSANEPPPGTGWKSPQSTPASNQPSASTPAFGPKASGLTGGYVSLPRHQDEPVIGRSTPPTPGTTFTPAPESPTPTNSDSDTNIPDPGQARELPI